MLNETTTTLREMIISESGLGSDSALVEAFDRAEQVSSQSEHSALWIGRARAFRAAVAREMADSSGTVSRAVLTHGMDE